MAEPEDDKKFNIRIPWSLFAELQLAARELGYTNPSEATRDAIRDLVERAKRNRSKE